MNTVSSEQPSLASWTEDALRYAIITCTKCPLATYRQASGGLAVPALPGKNYNGFAILGEAPGKNEAAVGLPFQGKAGQFLAELVEGMGVSMDDLLLLNVLRCRPPNNRIKSPEAVAGIAECDPWLRAELDLYNPSMVVVMGLTAAGVVFDGTLNMTKMAGTFRHTTEEFPYGERTWVMTAHPASVFYPGGEVWKPIIKRDLEEAWRLFNAHQS